MNFDCQTYFTSITCKKSYWSFQFILAEFLHGCMYKIGNLLQMQLHFSASKGCKKDGGLSFQHTFKFSNGNISKKFFYIYFHYCFVILVLQLFAIQNKCYLSIDKQIGNLYIWALSLSLTDN